MKRPARIVVGYDGSAHADQALDFALMLADSCGAEVLVLHATGLLERYEHRDVTRLPHQVAARVAASRLPATRVHFAFDDGDPCTTLLRAADIDPAADLIVVGTRGHTTHNGRLLGSTSLELAEHATVPVVIVPLQEGPSRT
ncbi:MAG: universal stress protein [Acidimicrobiales bacterium]